MMSCLGEQFGDVDVVELINYLDTNDNGTLELDEFVMLMALLASDCPRGEVLKMMAALRASVE